METGATSVPDAKANAQLSLGGSSSTGWLQTQPTECLQAACCCICMRLTATCVEESVRKLGFPVTLMFVFICSTFSGSRQKAGSLCTRPAAALKKKPLVQKSKSAVLF